MKGLYIFVFLGITIVLNAQDLPSKAEILADLKKVNAYYMTTFPETETISTGEANWLEGSYFNGHMAMFDLFPTTKGIRYALQWAENNSWNIGNKPNEADNQCVGQTYMDLFYAYGAKDDFMLSKVGTSVSNLVNRPGVNDWTWIDALYMAMPVLTRYGIYNNDPAYFAKLYNMYNSTKVTQGLFDASFGLWYRDKNFDPPYKTPGGKRCYWSRGNGWVFGAHVRTLQYLPKNDKHRETYIATFKQMAETLKDVQRSDGFWNVSLGDTTDYPGPETSGTAFFVYGLAWGINNGFLDKETYLPTVIKGWNGLITKALDSNGRIGYVQGVGKEPKSSQPVNFNSSRHYGEGNFLIAGTEVIKLAEGEMSLPDEFFVKGVELKNGSTLQLTFFEPAEKTSAQTLSNYYINKGVKVESATLSQDGLSCELTLSDLKNGGYGISFNHIQSVSGKSIAEGSGKYFLMEENTTSLTHRNRQNEVELQVYPNPASQNYIHIELSPTFGGKVTIQLFDTSGKLYVSENHELQGSGLSEKLSLNNLSKGLYFLKVEGDDFSFNRKVVLY